MLDGGTFTNVHTFEAAFSKCKPWSEWMTLDGGAAGPEEKNPRGVLERRVGGAAGGGDETVQDATVVSREA